MNTPKKCFSWAGLAINTGCPSGTLHQNFTKWVVKEMMLSDTGPILIRLIPDTFRIRNKHPIN